MESVSPKVLTVSQITSYLKSTIDSDYHFKNIFLVGEISNFTNHVRSGHFYLTLKDEKSAMKAVMFRSYASRLPFLPEDGMRVIAFGSISVYPASGQYQFYIENMQPDGVGSLSVAFEQLKEKLSREGLFDEAHKKPIPSYPKRIGVVTSPSAAAFQDIKNVLKRRWPYAEIVLSPAMVQGQTAAPTIVEALRKIDEADVDVVIAARGGGSIEDLWCFNDEAVARTVFAMRTPVVSGVGHETDFTIIDFVADYRAPTPSAAAELCSPDAFEEYDRALGYQHKMRALLQNKLNEEYTRLEYLRNSNVLQSFSSLMDERRLKIDTLTESLYRSVTRIVDRQRSDLSLYAGKLHAYSPMKVLARGYTMAQKEDGTLLTSVAEIREGDSVDLTVQDGKIRATVDTITAHPEMDGAE